MTGAEYKRIGRARAIAAGKCSVCCARPAQRGFRTCLKCRIDSNNRYAALAAGYELAKAAGLIHE